MLVVDPSHWLDADGSLPTGNPQLRRQMLRVARLIEYGGPLKRGESRETLIDCARRPNRKPCPGLLWVLKTEEDAIVAVCSGCGVNEAMVHNWQGTPWAEGVMAPVPPELGPIQVAGVASARPNTRN